MLASNKISLIVLQTGSGVSHGKTFYPSKDIQVQSRMFNISHVQLVLFAFRSSFGIIVARKNQRGLFPCFHDYHSPLALSSYQLSTAATPPHQRDMS
jgi:hypothetical protein